jgi:hypothetical protein
VTPEDVRRIVAIRNPVLRNLEITYAYSLLAAETARRTGQGANWCTFATWASRQAGRTIRGEDAIGHVQARLGRARDLLHPLQSAGRWLLRRGLFDRGSRLGRLTARLYTPFDAIELASDAVARGNLKVFEEIGYEFARYLAGEDPAVLRTAFARYDALARETDPKTRAELALMANLEIGLHEQTRLQPEIREALDAPYITAEDLGRRLCGGRGGPRLHHAVGRAAAPVQRPIAELSRAAITDSLMVLSLPGRILALGAHLDDPYPEVLHDLVDAELQALVGRFETDPDDAGARDWSDLHQRMHYIVHLFRCFHEREDLFTAPFTPAQVESVLAGIVPEGDL